MTLEADFLTTAADKLAENLDRIETCLTELPPASLWARDSENENAVRRSRVRSLRIALNARPVRRSPASNRHSILA